MAEPEIIAEPRKSGGRYAFRPRVFFVLFASFCIIILVAAGIQYRQQRLWEGILQQEITRDLTQKAQMLASRINSDHNHAIPLITREQGKAAGARATVIDSTGVVIADSENQVGSLQHEATSPEFVAALHGSIASEIRRPNDITVLYVAVPLPGGAVRLAYPLSDVEIAASQARSTLWLSCGIAALIAVVVSALVGINVRTG